MPKKNSHGQRGGSSLSKMESNNQIADALGEVAPVIRKKILYVSNFYPPHLVGGAEIVAHRHARKIADAGIDVVVFAARPPCSTFPAGMLDVEVFEGLIVYRVALHSLEPEENFLSYVIERRFTSVIEVERPEIVHFHNVSGLGASLIPLARRLGCHAVVTLHDYWGFCYRGILTRPDGIQCSAIEECASTCNPAIVSTTTGVAVPMRLRRDYVAWCLDQAEILIAPSNTIGDAYTSSNLLENPKTVTISNGLDIATAVPRSNEAWGGIVRFVCVAYLGEHKGILNLLGAVEKLRLEKQLDSNWSLTIVGDGHLREAVETACIDGNGRLIYGGKLPRDQVFALLCEADVFVLPSTWPENEPVSLLEAIAAGCALLTTDLGGMPKLVEPGAGGDVVAPTMDALVVGMREFIKDPSRSMRYGRYNHSRAHLFNESSTIDSLCALYRDLTRSEKAKSNIPVVLCGGDWPGLPVAKICHNFYRWQKRKMRLVWHGWLGSHHRGDASIYWNWSSGVRIDILISMLRSNIPIVGPATSHLIKILSDWFDVALVYETYSEAAELVASLPFADSHLIRLKTRASEAADFLTSHAGQDTFRYLS